MQSFRSPSASGLLFGIAPKSNQKGLAPTAVVRFASCESNCPVLLGGSASRRQYILYCCAIAAIPRRDPSGFSRPACDARHRERRPSSTNPCIPALPLDIRRANGSICSERKPTACIGVGHGWPASWIRRLSRCRASQRLRIRPAGARRRIAALAQQYTDVLSAQPRNAEKHRAVRFARCESNHRGGRWPFWLLFGAMPKSNPRSGAARKPCTGSTPLAPQ